ncbi:MAG: transcriptional regulator [Chloroflexi bacterium]|nr:transcriptional regulator [Chloroflexota bacterium]
MSMIIREIQPHWTVIRPYFSIRSEADYDRAVAQLNELLDIVGTDEEHPMYEFMDTLGTLVHAWEEENIEMPPVSGADVLRYLMEEHGLRQVDLPEIGSQGVVSEILNGRRELNTRQIRALAKRFHVSPAVFI